MDSPQLDFSEENTNIIKEHEPLTVEIVREEQNKKQFDLTKSEMNGVAAMKLTSMECHAKLRCLSKEDLEIYADDPFWKRVRLALLILFWVILFGLLGAAIFLVIVQPECPRETLEKSWHKNAHIYQIYVRSFEDSNFDGIGDLRGVRSKLSYLESLGVGSILLNPIVLGSNGNSFAALSYTEIDPAIGTLVDFIDLLEEAHSRNMTVVLDMNLVYTSRNHPWFSASEKAYQSSYPEENCVNHYVWHDGFWDRSVQFGDVLIQGPPNAWNQTNSAKSAWTWSESRQKYSLHRNGYNLPDLNFGSEKLRQEVDEILKIWLSRGVDGFRFLSVDKLISSPIDDFIRSEKFTDHVPVKTAALFRRWRHLIDDYVKNELDAQKFSKKLFVEGKRLDSRQLKPYGIDLVFNSNLTQLDRNSDGRWISDAVQRGISNNIANWAVGSYDQHRAVSRMGSLSHIDAINMLYLLLPGTAVTYFGDEVGVSDSSKGVYPVIQDPEFVNRGPQLIHTPWTEIKRQNTSHYSHLKVFQQLIGLRSQPAIRYGSFQEALVKEHFYSFIRKSRDHRQNYLVAIDLRKPDVGLVWQEYNLTSYSYTSAGKLTLASANLYSKNNPSYLVNSKGPIDLGNLMLRPGEAIVAYFPV